MARKHRGALLGSVQVHIAPDWYQILSDSGSLHKVKNCLCLKTAMYFFPSREYPALDCVSVVIYTPKIQSGVDMLVDISLYTLRNGDPRLDMARLKHVASALWKELGDIESDRRVVFKVSYVEAVQVEYIT